MDGRDLKTKAFFSAIIVSLQILDSWSEFPSLPSKRQRHPWKVFRRPRRLWSAATQAHADLPRWRWWGWVGIPLLRDTASCTRLQHRPTNHQEPTATHGQTTAVIHVLLQDLTATAGWWQSDSSSLSSWCGNLNCKPPLRSVCCFFSLSFFFPH